MESRNLQLRRLEIAKKILADVLASKERARAKPTDLSSTAPTKTSSEVEEEQQHQIQKERRRLEWNSALKDPIREASMFYIKSERELIEETKLDELTRKLYSLQSLPVRSSNMNYVIKTMMEGLRSAFFGCRYFIALLTKSDCTELDFLEWGTDKILQVSKPSPCFDCILQNTIVTVMIDQDSSSVCSLFVPIYSITGCLGVIEIRGLYPATTPEVSSSATLQRPLNNLKSAMQKGDFRSFPRKILWRSPVERAKEENLSSSNGIFLYSMVRGRVTEVHHEHAGIAFYGGPRFTVTWEDGTKEYLVNKYQFMDVFVNTPLSLGARTTATAALSANLIKVI